MTSILFHVHNPHRPRRFQKLTLLWCSLGFSVVCTPSAWASDPTPEIQYLLSSLANSNCQFERNGSWHSPSEASTHLTKKWHYFADKGKIATTEDFIELAASKSSMSGDPYHVQCQGEAVQLSQEYLQTLLSQYRQRTSP